MAILGNRLDIAAMLARKGAECTAGEIRRLGKKYTDFISSIRTEEQTRKEENTVKQGNVRNVNNKGKGN